MPSAPDSQTNWAQPWSYSNERDTFGTIRGEYDFTDNVTGWFALGKRSGSEAVRTAMSSDAGYDEAEAMRQRLLETRRSRERDERDR